MAVAPIRMTLTYDDPRYGDRYEVELSPTGVFLSAVRFVEGIGRDPIVYDKLSHVPQPHQNELQHLIWMKMNPPKR